MNKQHILGFFDDLVRTPVFLFLCAMFLCGAAAGGLTGLRAGEGDGAAVLSGLLAELPAHVVQSTLCALIWVLLPLVCAFLRPRELLLSAVAAGTRLRTCHDRRGQCGRRKCHHHRSGRRTRRAERLRAACRVLYGLAGRRSHRTVFAPNVQDAVFPVHYARRAERPPEGRDSGTVQCVSLYKNAQMHSEMMQN